MAEPLKNAFGPAVPRRIADDLAAVHPGFPRAAFLRDCLNGYEALELLPRARRIARALGTHLPADYPKAARLLIASLGPALERTKGNGMSPFLYLPHVLFVAEFGSDHFEESMRAQYELTQRFTAEFSLRVFLEKHPAATLARLKQWTADPNEHIRRLVSEGTRPRLPWAPRLREFQRDPRPVLALLERLKDDESDYVRRSVANNLNDIGKDHPRTLTETAVRWLKNATAQRRRLVRHALRTALKRGEPGALAALGFEGNSRAVVGRASLTPRRVPVGGSVSIGFEVTNAGTRRRALLVDFRIHFMKANGRSAPKVFKLTTLDLPAGASRAVRKTVSLKEMTTRKHHPGRHAVDALINGRVVPLGHFELTA